MLTIKIMLNRNMIYMSFWGKLKMSVCAILKKASTGLAFYI